MSTATRQAPGPRGSRYRTLWLAALLTFAIAPAAHAQLLADVLMTTAISAQFDAGVSFPRGTMRAVGKGVDALVARIPDSGAWTDWEAYALGGVVVALAGAKVHEISTAYAVAGYFEQERTERAVSGPQGPETHTRIVFVGEDGSQRLLYLIRAGQEVVWLTAKAR
ncbi:MAG: hypothetical protein WC972_07320 [Trueperaceae bacterium]|nr:hypothetical protein [Truepera sp.]HRN17958.1 hypothetical protein [Trueperaceae bacterium]HRQ10047.1 hypothetical protein [Trueperaceae bacterium]